MTLYSPSTAAERSVLQVLHGCCERAVKATVIPGNGLEWAQHYHQHIESDRFCLNEWEAMDDLESVRKDNNGHRWVKYQTSKPFSIVLEQIILVTFHHYPLL